MFSKEASKKLRQEFWTSFGKSFPRKWTLYNTRIKGLSLKFHFDTRQAIVALDIEDHDLENRIQLWEKLLSLKAILIQNYLSDVVFEEVYFLDNNKEISRIYVCMKGVSIHNKDTWQQTMEFLKEKMALMEAFFEEYKDYLTT
jgi:hypothetical protein